MCSANTGPDSGQDRSAGMKLCRQDVSGLCAHQDNLGSVCCKLSYPSFPNQVFLAPVFLHAFALVGFWRDS